MHQHKQQIAYPCRLSHRYCNDKMPNQTRPISEIDVLIHHASVSSSHHYVAGERLFAPRQPAKSRRKPGSDSIGQTKRRKLDHVKIEPKLENDALSLEDQILEQLDDEARRAGLETLSVRCGGSIAYPPHHQSTPRNVLPPPPPLAEDAPATDPRPRWSFTTTPLPPHLQRQAQLRSPAAPSTISEEDISEVDELATPGREQSNAVADTSGEGAALTGSPSAKTKQTEAGGTLLSLPRRLWSSIRPGLSL